MDDCGFFMLISVQTLGLASVKCCHSCQVCLHLAHMGFELLQSSTHLCDVVLVV